MKKRIPEIPSGSVCNDYVLKPTVITGKILLHQRFVSTEEHSFFKLKKLFILAAPGLSCGMQDLRCGM